MVKGNWARARGFLRAGGWTNAALTPSFFSPPSLRKGQGQSRRNRTKPRQVCVRAAASTLLTPFSFPFFFRSPDSRFGGRHALQWCGRPARNAGRFPFSSLSSAVSNFGQILETCFRVSFLSSEQVPSDSRVLSSDQAL